MADDEEDKDRDEPAASENEGGEDADAEDAEREAAGGEAADDDADDGEPAPPAKAADAGSVTAAEAAAGVSGTKPDSEGVDRMDLPKWNRSRVKRKAPKGEERDAFQDGVRSAGKRAIGRAPLVAAVVALAAGGLALGIYLTKESATAKADATKLLAVAAMYEARGAVEEPDPKRVHADPRPVAATEEELQTKVIGALSGLANTAADTPAHRMSRLITAGRSMQAGEFSEAEASYRAYLETKGDPAMDFLAREGMVLAIEAQGRLDEALTELEPLLAGDPRGFFRDQALWHKGRIIEAKGDVAGAVTTYHEYVEHFPLAESSFAREQVVARLIELDDSFVPPPPPEGAGMPGFPGLQLQ